ncbi:MAG: hypothetical protein QOC62_2476 [Mycobacterium sp.]|nr:hypothetical protein [Mycobacterium sp.]
MTDDLPRTTFTGLAQRTGLIPDAELDAFWATLEPASIEFMLGEWKGGEFNTGHAINGVLPRASLWMEEFRGEVTATMVYDGQAVHDHFKKIDDDTVMGIMNGKAGLDNGRCGYFYLERA